MQPDQIVLEVDHDADGGTTPAVTKTFTRRTLGTNRDQYIADDHTPDSVHELVLYRTDPKKVGTFLGALRSAAKITKAVPVTNSNGDTVTGNVIMELSFSVPVSADEADVLEIRQTVLALLSEKDIMDNLVNLGLI